MNADQLVAAVRDSGGSLRLAGGCLMLGNLKALPAVIVEAVREQKPAIVALLAVERSRAVDTLNQAGIRLPVLPGGRRTVAAPRSTWSTTVADALGLLGYSDLPVVLLDRRHKPADLAMNEAAWEKVRTGEFFERASAVDLAVRWVAPRWPEHLRGQGQIACCGCAHFVPDAAGCGGIGSCKAGGEGASGRLPLFPHARRHCEDYVQEEKCPGGTR